jgi:dienelactone hydrolase
MSEDGTHLWWWQRLPHDEAWRLHYEHRGAPDASRTFDMRLAWGPRIVLDDGSAVLALPEGLTRIDADGRLTLVLPTSSTVRWVERLPDADDLLAALATETGGVRVVRVALDGAPARPVFEHATADDVIFGHDLTPRFLLDQEPVQAGSGVRFVLSRASSPGGALLFAFRQLPWADDIGPSAHRAAGPVTLLGGDGDLGTRVVLDDTGVRVEPPTPGQWADATSLLVDPKTGQVDAVGWYAERLHWHALTPVGQDLAWLEAQLDADVRVMQRVLDDRTWLVRSESGHTSPRYWRFDRDLRTVVPVGPPHDLAPWRPMHARVLTAPDGQKLAAYVTTPDPEHFGPGPWPLVVPVHGGPWSGRELWRLNADAQRNAERGRATLIVEFRGTFGFGWRLATGRDARFGREMLSDVLHGIDTVVDEGVADPERIAMVGASYGGWAALTVITGDTPRLRCAVAGVPLGNLLVPNGHLSLPAVGGRRWRKRHSPDRHTSRLSGPVLVWTGGKDGLDPDGIATFVERAERDGHPVTWIRFPDEGHGLQDPANILARDVIIDRFLGSCLGGPSWELPDGPPDAHVEVRAGADGVPGLEDWSRRSAERRPR